jgi:hypothetical protein
MDYKKIYDDLISKARSENRIKGGDIYYEAHHIIPKCMGGEGKIHQWKTHSNIILLKAKEHFVAHKLLCEIYPSNDKLKYAIWMMCNAKTNKHNRTYIISSNEYEFYKKEFSKTSSKIQKGKKLSDSHKLQLSIAARNRTNEVWNKGIPCHESTKKKLSERWKGTTRSLEDRKKISAGQLGKKRKIITCPHCNKSGGNNAMKIWHFDKCKLKNNEE